MLLPAAGASSDLGVDAATVIRDARRGGDASTSEEHNVLRVSDQLGELSSLLFNHLRSVEELLLFGG